MMDEREPQDDDSVARDRFGTAPPDALRLLGAGVAGALLGATTLWLLGRARAGDEPPIRVKGGSIHLDVLSRKVAWESDDAPGKKWRLSRGERRNEEIDVWIVGSGRCEQELLSGRTVRVQHTAGKDVHWVEVKATGRRLKITDASHGLTPSNANRRVTLGGPGFISRVVVDGTACDFADGELEELLLLDR